MTRTSRRASPYAPAMSPLKALVPALLALLLMTPGAVNAETEVLQDPAGDGLKEEALDITTLEVANRDHAIVTTVSFVRAARGDLAVWVKARGEGRRTMIGVASIHRAHRDRTILLAIDGEQQCKGLKATWDHETEEARVRLPSRCFLGGDYGAVKIKVITEIGSDADLAPKDASGDWSWTGWVARG